MFMCSSHLKHNSHYYISFHAIRWCVLQWPLVQEMAKTGTPFESITVAAGVPTPEKANELMDQVRA